MHLTRSGFSLLSQCNGTHDLETNEIVENFLSRGLLRVAEEGDQLSELQRYSYSPHGMLTYAQIAITGRCNYNCLHCFSSAKQERLHEEFSKEELFGILEQLEEVGVCDISITGGEPLLHPNFLDILQRCKELNVHVKEILTNGSLLTPALLQKMKEIGGDPCIGISFDGLGTHNHMRCNDRAEEAAIAAMRVAVEAGFKVKATINVNQNSIPRLIETCQFLVELGCAHLFLIRTSETPKWFYSGEEPTPYDDYYIAALDVVDVYLREKWPCALQIFNGPNFSDVEDTKTVYTPNRPDCMNGRLTSCSKCAVGCFVAHNGRVIPCDAFEGTSTVYGDYGDQCNLKNRSIYDILVDSQLTEYKRDRMDDMVAENEKCGKCPWLYSCRGGCRAFGYGITGNRLAASPVHCTYYRGGHVTMLKELVDAHKNGVEDTKITGHQDISLYRIHQKEDFLRRLPQIKAILPEMHVPPDWAMVRGETPVG